MGCRRAALLALALLFQPGAAAPAQTPQQPQPAPQATQTASPAAGEPPAATSAEPPHGQVLFQSHGEPPPAAPEPSNPHRRVLPPAPQEATAADRSLSAAGQAKEPELTDRERSALLFTGYDLDARLSPASSRLTVRARITVANAGDAPLPRIALQVSSTLVWESVSLLGPAGAQPLALAQHVIDTDADHTGKASEGVLELPEPLAPGRSVSLDAFYSGAVPRSAERLLRIGATDAQGASADWDAIGAGGIFLRGFGDVLWYPVSAPQVFLGEGTRLFDAVDRTKLREQTATVRLRLSVEYTGDPPTAAYFCGRRAAFTAISDVPDAPIATGSGVATAEFAAEPLGFRVPSLFVVDRPETLAGALPGELAGGQPMLAVESTDPSLPAALGAAAEARAPLLQQWLGARPLSALTVLDHPGQPFQDGPLLVAPGPALTTSDAGSALTFSLAHGWLQSGRPWIDEGVAEFLALLNTEQTRGREAMVAQLGDLLRPLADADLPLITDEASAAAVAEGAGQPGSPPLRESLVAASSELYFRRKAAAVWLMLREIAGEQALQITLQQWRLREPDGTRGRTTADQDALALEAMLEKNSGKDLHRFFDDWVLHDHGLPELTVAEVTPRQLTASDTTKDPGWLTVVTVTNAGAAAADVPVIVSAGSFSTTVRMLVPGAGSTGPGSATARIQTESAPTEVQVNDGITPEVRSSVHRREVRSR